MRRFVITSALVMTFAASLPSAVVHAQTYDHWSYERYDGYGGRDRGYDDREDDEHVYRSGWRDGYENDDDDSYAENDRSWRDHRSHREEYRCSRGSKSGGTALGAIGGGVLGHIIAPRRDKLLGTVIGGLAGGVVGNQIADAKNRC